MDTRWLLSRLEQRKETIASLARAVGRDRAAMSRIVNGEQPLQLWMTPILAEKLGVSETELLSRTGELSLSPVTAAPIIPWHSVGAFAMTKSRIDVSSSYPRVYVSIESDTLIALRVDTDAMQSLFPPGSIVAVDYSQKELNDQEIGVFAVSDHSVLRRYNVQRKRAWLSSDDGDDEEMGEIVGRVVGVPILARTA